VLRKKEIEVKQTDQAAGIGILEWAWGSDPQYHIGEFLGQ
jgi:hypothetical protein